MKLRESLFCQDNLSSARTTLSPLSSSSRRELQEGFLSGYAKRVGRVVGVDAIGGPQVNSVNYRVRSPRKTYLLKTIETMSSKDRAVYAEQLRIVRSATKNRILFPKIVPSDTGMNLMSQSNRTILLMEYVAGLHFDGSLGQLDKVARPIGNLHAFLRSLDYSKYKLKRRYYLTQEDRDFFEWLKKRIKAKKVDPNHPLEKYFVANWQCVESSYELLQEKFRELMKVAPAVTHIDVHPHNLLVDSNGKVVFLDVDAIFIGNPLVSIGFSVFKLMRNTIVRQGKDLYLKHVTQQRDRLIGELLEAKAIIPNEVALLKTGALLRIFLAVLLIGRDHWWRGSSRWACDLPKCIRALYEYSLVYGEE